jgi:hypothetical protein
MSTTTVILSGTRGINFADTEGPFLEENGIVTVPAPIQTYQTLGQFIVDETGAISIIFSEIPQNFTDLILTINGRIDGTGDALIYLQFNGDTDSNYDYSLGLNAQGSGYFAHIATASNFGGIGEIATNSMPVNAFGSIELVIHDYTNNIAFKSCDGNFNIPDSTAGTDAGFSSMLWLQTVSINSVTVLVDVGSDTGWVAGSKITLYGRQ